MRPTDEITVIPHWHLRVVCLCVGVTTSVIACVYVSTYLMAGALVFFGGIAGFVNNNSAVG